MEVLKKVALSFAVVMLMSVVVIAQDNASQQAAFLTSYQLEAKGDYAKAVDALKSSYNDMYETNMRLGWLCYMGGQLAESVTYYKKATDAQPYSIEAKFGVVLPLAAMGNWDQVVAQYKDILKIDAEQTTALYRLGLIFYNRSDFENAKSNFERVVNLYPMDYSSTLMLAWTYTGLKKPVEAKVLFNKILLLSPSDKSATAGLAVMK
jgi:tetratricopeptide (TPR) repeat protein